MHNELTNIVWRHNMTILCSRFLQMSELPESIIVNKTNQNMSPEMATMLENFNKKNPISPPPTTPTSTLTTNGLSARQNLLNSSSNSTSSVSKSSQQVSHDQDNLLTRLRLNLDATVEWESLAPSSLCYFCDDLIVFDCRQTDFVSLYF